MQRDLNHASNLYGDYVDAARKCRREECGCKEGPLPAGANLPRGADAVLHANHSSGVGMHQGFLPGVPDSHGCIRMPEKMARLYWDNAPLGTPVTVESNSYCCQLAERRFSSESACLALKARARTHLPSFEQVFGNFA